VSTEVAQLGERQAGFLAEQHDADAVDVIGRVSALAAATKRRAQDAGGVPVTQHRRRESVPGSGLADCACANGVA